MSDSTARTFKIERLNTHNGPGFRTVIFFKGCPLHCTWCHNPEGISARKQVWFHGAKCIGCQSCIDICPIDALTMDPLGINIDRMLCTGCYKCIDVCPSKALSQLGEDLTVDDLMQIILKDKGYFDSSWGGITVTGGEPGIYADFIADLFKRCRENGVQTAFDTSGAVPLHQLEHVLKKTDLLFLDLKIIDKERSKTYTGLDINAVMRSINWLKSFMLSNSNSPRLTIRTPLIPELTDTDSNLESIAKIIKDLGEELVECWELCEFNLFWVNSPLLAASLILKWGN